MKPSLVVLVMMCTTAYGQLTKVCYDKNEAAADERMSEYCVIGKTVEFAVFPGSRDSMWHFVDTVRAFYTASRRIKFLKIYNADGLEEGNYIEYFTNGKIKERGVFRNGKRVGLVSVNYPSGKPHYTLQYFPDDRLVTNVPGNFKIHNYFDEYGMQLVKSGEGICNCIMDSLIREVGNVRDGLRDSIWSGYSGDTLVFMESYREGKFIDGVAYFDGTSFRYTKFEEQPSYQGGHEEMMNTISSNLKIPAIARKKGIDGTVLVSFILKKDGTMADFKVMSGIHPDCDNEAVRVVRFINKWNPGRQRGRPVDVRLNIPIKYNTTKPWLRY